MSNDQHMTIVGGPPEFWILPGLWKRHKKAVLIAAVLAILAVVAVSEWVKVRPATVQFFHNDKLIKDLVVTWPSESAFQFDSETATLKVTRFQEGRRQTVLVSSSVLNLVMTVTSGEHAVIRHYVSPKTGRTATITQTTRMFLGVFKSTEIAETASFADSEVGKSVIRTTPISALVSQIRKEALAATGEQPSQETGTTAKSPK